MPEVSENLDEIRLRISAACKSVGREPGSVELIAVSKTFSCDAIRDAQRAGQLVFAESRLQEAEEKARCLPDGIRWHFVGRIQRNKVRKLIGLFETLHAVDSLRLAMYMNEIAGQIGLCPKVFLQVNIGREASKGGFEVDVLRKEIEDLLPLPHLEILGLMCIPPIEPDPESTRRWFAATRTLRDELEQATGTPLPCLSMGMSGDFEIAIQEGATHVRVGSAIFGERAYRVDGELG